MQSVRAGMHAMDANGANVAGFHITHWRTDPGSVDYYLSHDGDYLSYNSVCLHEVGSAEAWEATERNFLQLCELTANMDLGWNPGTVAPPPPWFATALYPSFFAKPEEVIRRFEAVEQCIVWVLLQDFRERFSD